MVGVLFELGKVKDKARGPGILFIIPLVDRIHRVSLRIVTMPIPLALQLRNLQTLVEIAVDKNSTVVFPAPLMSTISELGTFLNREVQATDGMTVPVAPTVSTNGGPAAKVA